MVKGIIRKVIEATRKRPDLSKTLHPIGGTDYKTPVGCKRPDPSKITPEQKEANRKFQEANEKASMDRLKEKRKPGPKHANGALWDKKVPIKRIKNG